MRLKGIYIRKNPLNLTDAQIAFGKLREAHPELIDICKLGAKLVRELRYNHKLLRAIRPMFPNTHKDYFDPVRIDTALLRTTVYDAGKQPNKE